MNLRNPSRPFRAMLVAGAYCVPGAIAGLMLGIWLPYPRFVLVTGALAGAMTGFWIEFCG